MLLYISYSTSSMKNNLYPILFIFLFFGDHQNCQAQHPVGRVDKLYTMSGVGLSLPIGETKDFMRPKFSTTIGINLGLGTAHLFLYPKISLHVFGYDELAPETESVTTLQRGRSTTYLLNVALGYRKIINKFSFYGFVGAGGGFILTPRIIEGPHENIVLLNNKTNHMGIIEPGLGIEYNIGGANLFIESSYMYGLGKLQERAFHAVPIAFGIKPNLSRIFHKKTR